MSHDTGFLRERRRKRLQDLFPCEIVVGDRVVISAGPRQEVVGVIVKEKKEVLLI